MAVSLPMLVSCAKYTSVKNVPLPSLYESYDGSRGGFDTLLLMQSTKQFVNPNVASIIHALRSVNAFYELFIDSVRRVVIVDANVPILTLVSTRESTESGEDALILDVDDICAKHQLFTRMWNYAAMLFCLLAGMYIVFVHAM